MTRKSLYSHKDLMRKISDSHEDKHFTLFMQQKLKICNHMVFDCIRLHIFISFLMSQNSLNETFYIAYVKKKGENKQSYLHTVAYLHLFFNKSAIDDKKLRFMQRQNFFYIVYVKKAENMQLYLHLICIFTFVFKESALDG